MFKRSRVPHCSQNVSYSSGEKTVGKVKTKCSKDSCLMQRFREDLKINSKGWLLTKKGGVRVKTNMLIIYFIFLLTLNIASRLPDS